MFVYVNYIWNLITSKIYVGLAMPSSGYFLLCFILFSYTFTLFLSISYRFLINFLLAVICSSVQASRILSSAAVWQVIQAENTNFSVKVRPLLTSNLNSSIQAPSPPYQIHLCHTIIDNYCSCVKDGWVCLVYLLPGSFSIHNRSYGSKVTAE